MVTGSALAEEELLLIRNHSLISDILRVIGHGFAALLDCC
jgi:hypothetical protein